MPSVHLRSFFDKTAVKFLFSAQFFVPLQKIIRYMRHRIKSGKIGSCYPEKMKVETEEFESDEISEDIEEIIEEDTKLRGNDATIEALEFYYPADNND
jgi:hypothetical protein